MLRVLFVENRSDDSRFLLRLPGGFEIVRVPAGGVDPATGGLSQYHCILLDYSPTDPGSHELLCGIKGSYGCAPVIAVLPEGGEDRAPEALRAGADDCWVEKHAPGAVEILAHRIRRMAVSRGESLLRESAATWDVAHKATEREIFTSGPVVVFKISAAKGWPIEYVSPNVTQLGYLPEDFTSTRVDYENFVYPFEDVDRIRQEIKANVAAGTDSFEVGFMFRKADGDLRWLLVFVVLQRGSDGTVSHFHGYAIDDTARKNAELVLRESEERFRSMFEGSRDAVFIADDNARFVMANRAAAELTGYSVGELEGMSIPNLHEEEDLGAYEEFFSRIMGGEPALTDARILRKDGVKVDTEFSNSRIDIGRKAFMLSIARDLTERRRAESALRESEEKYRLLFENEKDAILILDPAEERILDANTAAAELFGYSLEELLSLPLAELSAEPEKSREVGRLVMQRGEAEVPLRMQRKKDGTVFPTELTISSFALKGKPVFCEIVRDISKRIEAAGALHESEERWKSYVFNAPNLILIVSRDGTIEFINKIPSGGPVDAYIGRSIYEYTSRKHHSMLRGVVERAFDAGETSQVQVDVLRKSGIKWWEASIAPLALQGKTVSAIFIATDISERVRAEGELRQAKEMLDHAQRIAHLGSWDLDAPSGKMEWSDEMFRMFRVPDGTTPAFEEWLASMMLVGEGNVRDLVDEALASRDRFEFDFKFTDRGGEERRVHSEAEVFRGEYGEPLRVIGTSHDVTEKRRVEEALRQSELHYRTLVETVDEGITFVDPEENMLFVNESCARIMGRSKESLTGANFAEFLSDEQYTYLRRQTSDRKAGISSRYEIKFKRGDGEERTAEITAAPVFTESGAYEGSFCAIRDITERKHWEEALEEHRSFLRQVIDANPNFIFAKDLRGGYALVNESMARFHGFEPQDYVGKRDVDLLEHDNYLEFWRSIDDHPLESMEGVELPEKMLEEADGSERWFRVFKRMLTDRSGEPTQVLGIVVDITPQKLHERDLERSRERLMEQTRLLAATNKELESFAFTVSHDLQAPLRRIRGWIDLLLEEYTEVLEAPGKEYLSMLSANCENLQKLINNLLNFSRVARTSIERFEIDLTELGHRIADELRSTEPARDVKLTVLEGMRCNADFQLMRIVVGNLLNNAWKYTRREPVGIIEFGAVEDAAARTFFVKDNGVGFNQAKADQLFTAFKRLHSDEDFEGTGIGLATVQRIIHRHGGSVWAESEPGQGAVFYFTVPNR